MSLIFLFAFTLRFLSIWPANTIVGFDQARDFFDARKIISEGDLRIIGPTAGNNPNLHHGVLYLYYLIPPLVFLGGNPTWAALWNSLFNAATLLVLFFLNKSLFNARAGLFAAIIAASSFQFIQYSGWLSNPSPTLLTVPLFFLGLWSYLQKKNWGLALAGLALGISIQFELFFLYLIPTLILFWLLFRPKLPHLKLTLISLGLFCLSTLTMILTEVKYSFAGVFSLLGAGDKVGFGKASLATTLPQFLDRVGGTFAQNLWPIRTELGIFLAVLLIGTLLLHLRQKGALFILLYLLSPALMLLLGYHNAPWFLIGLPPAIALAAGFALSKIRYLTISAALLVLIVWANTQAVVNSFGKFQLLLEPDQSSQMSKQLQVIDYTYTASNHEPFTINTLTNPLYINAVWGYHYSWYGWSKYGYLPSWSGGDQLHPYDTLPKANGQEKYLYLIMDQTFRIPYSHKLSLIEWADQKGRLVEEKDFDGLLVQKRLLIEPN